MTDSNSPAIIIVSYHFPPGPEIGGYRPFRFYKYLQRIGVECHVVTSVKPTEPVPPLVHWVPDELANVWESGSDKKRGVRGRVEYLLRRFMFPGQLALVWAFDAVQRCRQIVRANPKRKHVILTTYPPLGIFLAGLMARKLLRIPWISDFRDPVDLDSLKLPYFTPRHVYWHRALDRAVFRSAQEIIANTDTAREMLTQRHPWAADKMHVIFNGFDPEDQPKARPIPDRPKRVIVHAGALYFGRNPNAIIESMARLWATGTPEANEVCISLLGEISKVALNQDVYEAGQRDGWLELRPPVSKQEARLITEEADGLLLIQPQSNAQIPGKLFEYICIGRPILALVPRQSAVEDILRKAEVPFVCVYADDPPDAVDRKLVEFLRLPVQPVAYSDWFRDNFNAEHQARQLAAVVADAYSRAAQKPSA